MTFRGYLTQQEIKELTAAADAGGLLASFVGARRDALLSGIPSKFAAGLALADNPLDQITLDLVRLNRVERTANGEVPLLIFLRNAADWLQLRDQVEARIFEQAHDRARNAAASAQTLPDPVQLPEIIRNEHTISTDTIVREGAPGAEPRGHLVASSPASSPKAQSAVAMPAKSRWRAALNSPWTVGIAAPLIVAALIAVGARFITFARGNGGFELNGSVACESGRPVVDVWIAASTGQSDSGYAHLGPVDETGLSSQAGSDVAFSYLLRHGGVYTVHVGCGGSASLWASRNFSPALSVHSVHLRCNDPSSSAGHEKVPEGKCVATSSP